MKDKKWVVDSRCSRHISGEKQIFTKIDPFDGGHIKFGNNATGKVVGIGEIGKDFKFDHMLLVKGLKHNLLSVSQICDNGCRVTFDSTNCIVTKVEDNSTILVGQRVDNIYIIDLESPTNVNFSCLASFDDDS